MNLYALDHAWNTVLIATKALLPVTNDERMS
jgi:hypothetical protein